MYGVLEKNQTYQSLGLKTIGLQVVITITGAVIAYFVDNLQSGISVLWGGFCAMLNVCLLVWRMCSDVGQDVDASRQLRLMYRSALERFFIVVGLLAFGMLRLKFAPLAILLGFIAGQTVLILVPLIRGIAK